jgi:hypothetical protein
MKEMQLSNKTEIRISILLALAIAETVGLLHFYGQPTFTLFIASSLMGIILIVPLLWIEWMQRRGISYFHVFIAIGICVLAIRCWNEGGVFYRLAGLGLALLFAIRILRRMLHHVDVDQQEMYLKAIGAEDKRLGSITGSTAGLVISIFLTLGIGSGHASVLWAVPLAIPISWFTWRLIIHLFFEKQNSVDLNDPTEILTEQGGLA